MAQAKALSYLVARVTRQAVGPRPAALARLIADWPLIVGPDFAARAVPARLSSRRRGAGATLTLAAAPAEAIALQHESARLLQRIESYFGERVIDRIALTQARAWAVTDRRRVAWPDRGTVPDAAAVDRALGPAARTAGPETAESLRTLARAVLARDVRH